MISKDQFLELKHLKSLGLPTMTIAKKIGISVPNANKWLKPDEAADRFCYPAIIEKEIFDMVQSEVVDFDKNPLPLLANVGLGSRYVMACVSCLPVR